MGADRFAARHVLGVLVPDQICTSVALLRISLFLAGGAHIRTGSLRPRHCGDLCFIHEFRDLVGDLGDGAYRGAASDLVSQRGRVALGEASSVPFNSAVAARFAALTAREREVVEAVVSGRSNQQIADEFYPSPLTVKTHANRAMMKVGALDRAQLVSLAVQAGILPQALRRRGDIGRRKPTAHARARTTVPSAASTMEAAAKGDEGPVEVDV